MNDFEASIRALVREAVRDEFAKLGAQSNDAMLSTVEAAAHARVVPATIRRWIAKGKLRQLHAGRKLLVSRADLDRWLKTSQTWNDSMTPEQRARRDHG